jgi:hypothetical protein
VWHFLVFIFLSSIQSCGEKKELKKDRLKINISSSNFVANLRSINDANGKSFGDVHFSIDQVSLNLRHDGLTRRSDHHLMILDGFNCPFIDRNNDGLIDGNETFLESGPVILDVNRINWNVNVTNGGLIDFNINLDQLWNYMTQEDRDSGDYLIKISSLENYDFEERPVILMQEIKDIDTSTLLPMPGRSRNEVPLACGKLVPINAFEVRRPPVEISRKPRRIRKPQIEDDDVPLPTEEAQELSLWQRLRGRVGSWWRRVRNRPHTLD